MLAGKATAKGVGECWQCDCHFGEEKDLATNLEGKTILDHFVTYATPSWPISTTSKLSGSAYHSRMKVAIGNPES